MRKVRRAKELASDYQVVNRGKVLKTKAIAFRFWLKSAWERG